MSDNMNIPKETHKRSAKYFDTHEGHYNMLFVFKINRISHFSLSALNLLMHNSEVAFDLRH